MPGLASGANSTINGVFHQDEENTRFTGTIPVKNAWIVVTLDDSGPIQSADL
jgi:hypothetical protein